MTIPPSGGVPLKVGCVDVGVYVVYVYRCKDIIVCCTCIYVIMRICVYRTGSDHHEAAGVYGK